MEYQVVPEVGVRLVVFRFSAQFTTERMPWAAVTGNTLQSGFLPGECLQETISLSDE